MAFDVAVEQFDGVQLGCVPGHQVHLHAGSVLGQPVPHGDPAVHRMPVHNQVDLPVDLADQADQADQALEVARNTGPSKDPG
jgi:hypothetical protein